MQSILFVSKPVVPPWNDSGKNLVKDLAQSLDRYRATVMTRAGEPSVLTRARTLQVYGARSGGFAPALKDQARVFSSLLTSRGHSAWHFFFAPNPRSCLAGRLASRARRARTLHTLSSAPKDARAIVPLLFADVNIVLSRHTEAQLTDAGLAADRLTRIAPAIEPLAPLSIAERRAARTKLELGESSSLIVYPGDLEFGQGAELMIHAFRHSALRDTRLVLACRAKTARAKEAERALRALVAQHGLASRVFWIGETPHIHALLGCADIVALPSTDLYAKMDYPLVLLEAMSLARPVVVASDTPAAELTENGAALAVAADAEALAVQLASLVEDSSRARAMGRAARDAVLEKYTARAMARRYEDLYDTLLR